MRDSDSMFWLCAKCGRTSPPLLVPVHAYPCKHCGIPMQRDTDAEHAHYRGIMEETPCGPECTVA
jgi:hypothetical protein